jgi:hypothetical protein
MSVLQKLRGEFSMILCQQGLDCIQKMETAARIEGSVALEHAYSEMIELFENIRNEIERLTRAGNVAG